TPTAVVELVEEAGSETQGRSTPQLATAEAATVVATALVAAPVTYGDLASWIAESPWPEYLWGHVECIVMRESRGQPWQVNLVWPDQSYGLMQINISPNANPRYAEWDLLNPVTNLAAGWDLYQRWQAITGYGFTPWG